jgi:hypothetical protein
MASAALSVDPPAIGLSDRLRERSWDRQPASSAALTQHSKKFLLISGEQAGQFVVETPELPKWIAPTIGGLVSLLRLKDNWDTYGGKRTNLDLIKQALYVLTQIMEKDSPAPSVVPLGDGGLQIEWHRKQQDLEIVFQLDSAPTYYYEDRSSGKEKVGFATDTNSLSLVFANLS